MKTIKFIHCADIHLDMPFTSLGSGNGKSSTRRMELRETFKNIIQITKDENADFLFISGDLFEHNYVRRSTITFVKECLSMIPGTRVFIVPGNHDPYLLDSCYRNSGWNENVVILAGGTSKADIEDLGVCIYGAGFNSFYEEKSLVDGLGPVNPLKINILLTHGTVDMSFCQGVHNPMTTLQLSSLGMDYIALGHFHNRIEKPGGCYSIYNPGSPEPLGFDEPGEHGIFMGTVKKDSSAGSLLGVRFRSLNHRFYRRIEVYLDACSTHQQVISRILTAAGDQCSPHDLLDISLKGYLPKDYRINTEEVLTDLKDAFFYVKIADDTRPYYDFEEISKEYGLRGAFIRKLLSRIESCNDPKEKSILQKSLDYGLEAIEYGTATIADE